MSYQSTNHIFLYHASALALGGWVRNKGQFATLESVAPSVLSIAGGYCSASAYDLNTGIHAKFPFGEGGPSDFFIYVGHAFTEVRGVEDDDETPFGAYKTTVRSVLDDVRINDIFQIEHAEAIMSSVHEKPNKDGIAPEPKITIGDSNMAGVKVGGKKVGLTKRDTIDCEPRYGALKALVETHAKDMALVGKGGTADAWLDGYTDWLDVPEGAPDYARDIANMHRKQGRYLNYSLFNDADVPAAPGLRGFKTSVELDGFGRIFFGDVYASDNQKQLAMFRIDLGCDNCGGVGGSGGSTNGGPTP